MKRLFFIFIQLLALLSAMSCGTVRKVQESSDDKTLYDSYARDYFYLEGIRRYNNNEYDAAMDLMEHSLVYDTASAATCYNLAQFYMSLGDRSLIEKYSPTAERLLARAVRLDPDNYWYRRLLAMNYLRQNRKAEAIAQYEDISRRFPGRTDLLITLAGLYDEAGEYEKELRVLTRYGKLEDVADELKFQRFACYLQMGELDSAYYESDNPADVIELLMNTTRNMLEQAETQIDRIKCRSLLDVAMKFCDVVSYHEPELVQAYSQKAIANMWIGDNDMVLKVLDKGIRNVRTGKDRAELYSLRGDFHHNLKQTELMYADYDSALVYNPDNQSVLNNYAYFLSLEDKDLNRALSMSARSLEIEPLSSTFLDTYAWILFRLKRYKESLSYMEKALRYLDSDNPEIYEHYGDVLYMCGEKDKALENWHKAMQMNSTSKTIDRKIREEKYVE